MWHFLLLIFVLVSVELVGSENFHKFVLRVVEPLDRQAFIFREH